MKDAVDIPVFASGDIFGRSSIEDTMLATGCDGVLVARGSLGNPWIFSGGPEPDLATKKEALKKHLSYIMAYRHTDQRGKVAMMRKAALWYIKAFPFAAKMRGIIASKKTHESLVELIDGIV
jgi:tRNA-dihydrouridine synthase